MSATYADTMYKALIIGQIKEEVQGVKTFSFEGEEAESMRYAAGQYLTLVLPHRSEEIRRSYSITSSPVLSEPLTIGVRRIENGVFSRYLYDQARVGDTVLTTGAAGFFTLPAELAQVRQLFFFAAGSGITPILSLMKTALYSNPEVRVVLVYSNTAPVATIFLPELQQLERDFKDRLHIEFLYSVSADLARARLHKDLLMSLVKQFAVAPLQNAFFYLCGPSSYMTMCSYGIRLLGVPPENIRRENFSTLKVVTKVEPPDKEPHQVKVLAKGEERQFMAQYPTTVLQAAKKAGLLLPYSCEAGKCGNCVARCLEGKVWMSYNEVLTERSLKNGLVLTCVGHPIGGDVVLEIL